MIKNILLLTILLAMPFQLIKANIIILNGLTHNYNIEAGKVYKGKISIENTGKQTQDVKLFLQDFTYNAEGSIIYSAPNTNVKTNSEWIKINTNLIRLKAKEKTEVFYEITVPKNAPDDGSYWSVIIVEPVEDIKPTHDKPGVSITSVVRYAIQVITDLHSENAKPDLKFEGIKIEKDEHKKILKVAIANKGNLYCKAVTSIDIYNKKDGQKISTLFSQAMGLLPQTSKSFQIDLSTISSGKYNAVIITTDENENAFALNVELEIKDD